MDMSNCSIRAQTQTKKKIKMPWNAIIGSFNSIDKIIVIKNIDWVAKKATSSTLLELF